jgi:hypothetical protein
VLLLQESLYSLLIEVFCLPFGDGDGILRTVSQTGTEAIAKLVTDQPCFAVNDLKGAFSAIGNTKSTAVTFLLINLYNLSRRHCLTSPSFSKTRITSSRTFCLDLSQKK